MAYSEINDKFVCKVGVFNAYSAYYDLLNKDKDYVSESEYVARLLNAYCPSCREVMELGAGTGRYTTLLTDMGYQLRGIDCSREMLRIAMQQVPQAEFYHADIRNYRSGKTFDAVIALFHVMSYMTADDDLHAAFATAAAHLKPGGFFLFDCWYGPAVLSDPPNRREKEYEDERLEISRKARPEKDHAAPLIRVHFDFRVRDKKSGQITTFKETHPMRYLFSDEVQALFEQNGMEAVYAAEWMSGQPLSDHTWYACFGGKKNA